LGEEKVQIKQGFDSEKQKFTEEMKGVQKQMEYLKVEKNSLQQDNQDLKDQLEKYQQTKNTMEQSKLSYDK
jgi:regulator of replication initiation timing